MVQPTLIADRYQIVDTIGDGAMGMIYSGIDLETSENVAIKALKLDVVGREPSIIARFEREGEALRQLNHPNIVKILATVHEGENYYLIMEYIKSGSLDDLLEKVPRLTIKQVLKLGLGIADALTHTHEMGIIHRDIKPGNILIAEDGKPLLTDFGVARVADSHMTQTGMVMGTLEYLSPEAFEYFELDTRTDIWALGVTLFETLTGQFPFHGDSFPETMYEVMTLPVPDLEQLRPDAPIGFIDLLYRMLEKNREVRIPSVRMIGAELEAIQRGMPITSRSLRGSFKKITSQFEVTLRFDAPFSSSRQHHNLPQPTSPFVGRTHELDTLSPHLVEDGVRCIVLVGQPGIGTSRMALAAAYHHLEDFVDGVYMVPLADFHNEKLFLSTVAESIGYTIVNAHGETRDLQQQLVDYLRAKSMLIILDHVDHLLEGMVINDFIEALQTHTTGIKILATACTFPNIGAHLTVKAFDYSTWVTRADAKQAPLVQILLHSANRIQPDWDINPENLRQLYKLCRITDGIPLAMALVGGWVDGYSIKEIAERISQAKKTLTPETEESEIVLQATLNVAWNLLGENDQVLLGQLSVFQGGFLRDAAQEITHATLKQLIMLVNRGLVQRDQTGRYHFHPYVQQYVLEKLNDNRTLAADTYAKHSSYYASFVWMRGAGLKADGQLKSLRDIEVELLNIRSAWRYAIASAAYPEITKMAEPLGIFFELMNRDQEGIALFERAVQHIQQHPLRNKHRALSTCMIQSGRLMICHHQFEKAQSILEQSRKIVSEIERCPDLEVIEMLLGDLAMATHTTENAAIWYNKGLKRAEDNTNYHYKIRLLNRVAECASKEGDWEAAEKLNRTSLALAMQIGDRFGILMSRSAIAERALFMGVFEQAHEDFSEVLAFSRDTGNPMRITAALLDLSRVAFWEGSFNKAEDFADEAWTLGGEIGDRFSLGQALSIKGLIASITGNHVAAIDTLANSRAYITQNNETWGKMLCDFGMAHALCALNEIDRAIQYAVAALDEAFRKKHERLMVHLMVGFAAIYAHQNNTERGTELLALSTHHPARASWLDQDQTVKTLHEQLHSALPNSRFETCINHGKAMRLVSVVEEILDNFATDIAHT